MAPNGDQNEQIVYDKELETAQIRVQADNETGKVNLSVSWEVLKLLSKVDNFTAAEDPAGTRFVIAWRPNETGGISNAGPDTQC